MKYTTDDLISILHEWYEEHGYAPTQKDFNIDKRVPTPKTYIKAFGTWNKALKSAGIKIPVKMKLAGYNDGQVAAILVNMVRRAYNSTKARQEDKLPVIDVKGVKADGKIDTEKCTS